MQNLISIQTRADVAAIYKAATLDAGLRAKLVHIATCPTIAAQGPNVRADFAMRWWTKTKIGSTP